MPGQLAYNGIILDINRIRVARKAIMEGPNYLYTRHILHCRAYYNRTATAYLRGQNGPVPMKFNPDLFRDSPTVINFIELIQKDGKVKFNDQDRPALKPITVEQGVRVVVPNTIADAPDTDVAIRHYLMLPRKKLIHAVGSKLLLISSWAADPEMTTDVNNGPVPLHCNIVQIHGSKTFEVEFVIQTDINERRIYASTSLAPVGVVSLSTTSQEVKFGQAFNRQKTLFNSVVLSNVYSQEDAIDENFFLTRTTRGRVIFDTSMLQALDLELVRLQREAAAAGGNQGPQLVAGNALGAALAQQANAAIAAAIKEDIRGDPDLFRKGITELIPIPDNCKREGLQFAVDEHNNSLVYSFTDRELAWNIVTANYPNITQVQATQTNFGEDPDVIQTYVRRALMAFEGGFKGAVGGANAADIQVFGIGARAVGGVAGGMGGAALGWLLGSLMPANLPRRGLMIVIEIYGNRKCTKREMLDAATHILSVQMARNLEITNAAQQNPAAQAFLNNVAGAIGGLAAPFFGAGIAAQVGQFIQNLTFTGRMKVNTTFDLTGKHLVLTAQSEQGHLGALVTKLSGNVLALIPSAEKFGEGDARDGVEADNKTAVYQSAPEFEGTNPMPPGDATSRGMVLDRIKVFHPWDMDQNTALGN